MATNGNPMTMKSLIEVYLSTKEIALSEEENKFVQYLLFQRLSVLQSMGHLRYLGKRPHRQKKHNIFPKAKKKKKRKKTLFTMLLITDKQIHKRMLSFSRVCARLSKQFKLACQNLEYVDMRYIKDLLRLCKCHA